MSKIQWYINRLKAMNVREVMWRLDQKRLQKQERKRFAESRISVGAEVFNPGFDNLDFNADAMGLNFSNSVFGTCTEIHLLKGPDNDKWPECFSYSLDYKQRDDLGDARSNWERNRHFDWALLAKAYYVTREEKYFSQLQNTVDVWMEKNPFLHGISWTSAMEFAIRSINWMYALAFLMKARNDNASTSSAQTHNDNWASLCEKLRNGIINITEYLTKHYSRYSSANNHLLVEATAIGLAGYAFVHKPWQELAVRILTEELPKQNYSDGVNKELSLHYQTFGMEAYLLLMHVLQKQMNDSRLKINDCERWIPMLQREAEFVAHSVWREQAVCEFGDDDEGKILDLQGGDWHQWDYVLQLASLITGSRYSDFTNDYENIHWLFDEKEIDACKALPLYDALQSKVFAEGGNSFFRDKDDRVLVGIDHAALGFGSIAAHGHADALSFQMLVDGVSVFTDPGTYIYHCWLPERDRFRKTINHNTLSLIDSKGEYKDQSQMLGAFMWGQRATCSLIDYKIGDEIDTLVAEHDGYNPIIHRREFKWNKNQRELSIVDSVTQVTPYVVTFMLGADLSVKKQNGWIIETPTAFIELHFEGADGVVVEDAEVSPEYGVKVASKAIRVYSHEKELKTNINIKFK